MASTPATSQGNRGTDAGPVAERHFMHVFPTFAPGGVQIRMGAIISHFRRQGRHTIISLNGKFGAKSGLHTGVNAEFLAAGTSSLPLVRRLRVIRALLRALQPDLLLTYNWGAVEWALANRFWPLCSHIHLESGFGLEEARGQIRRRVWLRRLALGNTSKLIVPSRTLADLAAQVWRIDAEKIVHIPNGVDCDKFASPPVAGVIPGFNKRDGEVIVGTIAPLRREKNLGRLLGAFAHLAGDRDLRLLIIGGGPLREELELEAARLKIADRVVFAGHIDRPERVIGWIDVYALSSDTEQMPNTVIQAMAAGKPVAGLRVGDVGEIVSPENRPFIAGRGDDAEFEANLRKLVDDRGLRERVGQANRDHVRGTYNQDRMFESYAGVLDFKKAAM